MGCVFCEDPSRAGDIVFEDDAVWIVLHEDWSPRGHAMVVAKQHVENASDLTPDAWAAFAARWQLAERVILRETGAARAMILKLGIQTPHLHVHVYPAWRDADRAAVFAAFDGRAREPRDEEFVSRVARSLEQG